jgi:predicted ArsR family transcriptional regulator
MSNCHVGNCRITGGGTVPEAKADVSTIQNVLDELPATRAAIFRVLKTEGFSSIPRIAAILGVSHEAARKQVADLQRRGWIDTDCGPEEAARRVPTPGRRPVRYCLTPAGDHFFPKRYPELMIGLLESIASEGDDRGVTAVLARITDERVAELEPNMASLSLKRKMDRLRSIYSEEDPFTDVQRRGADYVLVERNCPYLNVALERPEICSTTVSALRRLTGCEVVRERRFQDGDARCEFLVRTADASPEKKQPRFEMEPPRTS